MATDHRIHVSLPHLRSLEGAARGLSFLPRQPAGSVLSGRHGSRLRGRGLNFEEMRSYLPGDDVRAIDWKATARTGSAHVRVFTEERDRPALLVVDQRMAMFFGSRLNMKSVTAAEAAAIAAFRILGAGDRVGGIVFDDEQVRVVAPRRSRRSVFALLEAISTMNNRLSADRPVRASTRQLNSVLDRAARTAVHDHLVIVFSDFDGIDDSTERRLRSLAAHNDVLLSLVYDPQALREFPARKQVVGNALAQAEVDFSAAAVREAVGGYTRQRLARIHSWQHLIDLTVLPLSAGDDTLRQLRGQLRQLAPRRRLR
ncbi:MAG: DUF58 domain-containing protein [Pseudohaliea sp.]